jgi:hypothetical protein
MVQESPIATYPFPESSRYVLNWTGLGERKYQISSLFYAISFCRTLNLEIFSAYNHTLSSDTKQHIVTIETSVKKTRHVTFHISVRPNIAMCSGNSLQMYNIVCVEKTRNCYNLLNGPFWAYVGYLY